MVSWWILDIIKQAQLITITWSKYYTVLVKIAFQDFSFFLQDTQGVLWSLWWVGGLAWSCFLRWESPSAKPNLLILYTISLFRSNVRLLSELLLDTWPPENFPAGHVMKGCWSCRETIYDFPSVTLLFCRVWSLAMFSWMSKDEARAKHGDIYEGVAEGLKGIYKWVIRNPHIISIDHAPG